VNKIKSEKSDSLTVVVILDHIKGTSPIRFQLFFYENFQLPRLGAYAFIIKLLKCTMLCRIIFVSV